MFRNSDTEQPQIQQINQTVNHTFIHMLCLSFEISKCFVIYIPLLNTQPKKIQQEQQGLGFDEISPIWKDTCFVSEDNKVREGEKHLLKF